MPPEVGMGEVRVLDIKGLLQVDDRPTDPPRFVGGNGTEGTTCLAPNPYCVFCCDARSSAPVMELAVTSGLLFGNVPSLLFLPPSLGPALLGRD